MPLAAPPHKFEALDGLRGLFALAIALFHLGVYSHVYDTALLRNSYLFVDFFFLLSGFVIAHASFNQLKGQRDVLKFAVRRFGRIWPLHAAALAILVVLEGAQLATAQLTGFNPAFAAFAGDGPRPLSGILTNLLLIQAFNLHIGMTWNLPAWSIGVEFYTYLLFALLAVLFAGRRQLVMFAVTALGGALMLALLAPSMDTTWDYGFFRCLFGFFTGCLVYRLLYRPSRGKHLPWPHVAEALALAAMLLFPVWAGYSKLSLLAPLAMALPLWVFARQEGFVSTLLRTRPLQRLGMLSYGIYMVHYVVLPLFNFLVQVAEKCLHRSLHQPVTLTTTHNTVNLVAFGSPWLMDLLTLAYLAGVIATAMLAARWIETPARNWFNARAARL